MSRRIPSLGQQMAAVMKPILRGRIDWMSLGYKFSDEGYTNPQGVHFKAFASDDGRMVSFYKRRTVRCPDPEKSGYPKVRNLSSIPLTECRKCQHHAKGCCALMKMRAWWTK